MSEYRVTFTELSTAKRSENEEWGSLFVYIQPPVVLNPDAVERYLSHGNLEPVERNILANAALQDVVVLGGTDEQTTIYASTNRKVEQAAQIAAKRTVEFLQFMGARAILDQAHTPDTNS